MGRHQGTFTDYVDYYILPGLVKHQVRLNLESTLQGTRRTFSALQPHWQNAETLHNYINKYKVPAADYIARN